MRVSVLTVAFLVAGGIGCSDSHTGGSTVVTTSPMVTTATAARAAVVDGGAPGGGGDMGGGGTGGGGGGGGTGDMALGAGPWPLARSHGLRRAAGLGGGILDANPDDAQNIWAAERRARSTSCAPAPRRSRRSPRPTGCTSGPSPIPTATPTRRASPPSPAAARAGLRRLLRLRDLRQSVRRHRGAEGARQRRRRHAQRRRHARRHAPALPLRLRARRRLLGEPLSAPHHLLAPRRRRRPLVVGLQPRRQPRARRRLRRSRASRGLVHAGDGHRRHREARRVLRHRARRRRQLVDGGPLRRRPAAVERQAARRRAAARRMGLGALHLRVHDRHERSLARLRGRPVGTSGYTRRTTAAPPSRPDGRLWLARLGGGLASWDPVDAQLQHDPALGAGAERSPGRAGRSRRHACGWCTSGGTLLRFDPGSGTVSTFDGVSGVTRIYCGFYGDPARRCTCRCRRASQ